MTAHDGIQAVLFDAAGTLIRPRAPIGVTYAELARAAGVELSPAAIGAAFRRTLSNMPPMVFPGEPGERSIVRERTWWRTLVLRTVEAAEPGARFPEFDAYFDRLFSHYADAEAWVTMKGAHDLLRVLRRRGKATAVVSNFDRRLPRILSGLGLTPLLDAVVLPSDAGAAKPDRGIFEHALEALSRNAAETVYVGDDPVQDIEAARAAGLHAIDVCPFANLIDLADRIAELEDSLR